ncbi:MAG: hypothetical protein EB828_04230 [Nitrosopumilus sp. D6]|nr:MAG: hypothetical protein EB828_04230 [Nitrosopumilus sp. D6]
MGSQAMAQALLLAVVITASGLATFLPDTHGEPAETESLYVSSDVFGGPMVLEIILRDDLVSDVTEPKVTFDGSVLRMTQGTDGHWYAYVADTNMARIIDDATKIAGTGMDFGVECNDPGFLKGSFDSTAVFTSGRTCDSSTDPGFMQMIRAAKTPADGATLGNNGLLDADHWPFIQTFEMSADYPMSIIRGVSDITIRFTTFDDRAALELDRESYPRNSDVHMTVRDMLLNVDPTSEDLWTFDVDGGEIYRRLFDGAGNLVDAGGKNLDPGQIYHYGGLLSGSNEIYNTISADSPYKNVISAVDNSLQDSTQVPTIGGSLVTIRETAQNSGVFTNTDRFNAANLHTGDINGTHKFTISYQDSQDRYVRLVASGVLGDDSVPFQKVKISNPRLADASGGKIGVISVGQQILVTSIISAYAGLDQNFAYIVRIQDGDDSTIHLGWLAGRLAGGQSFEPAQSWTPLEPGTYTATVFLWESIDNPAALSTPKSIVFTVS